MKLLILDKDGTLVRPASGNKFVQHPEDQELIPGVVDALQHYEANGWTLAIATNQGGVAAGYKTLEQAKQEVEYCMGLSNNVFFAAALCPDDGETAWCWADVGDGVRMWQRWSTKFISGVKNFRKPGDGMIHLLWDDTLHYDQILFVGDRAEDQEAAQSFGCEFKWANEWRAQ